MTKKVEIISKMIGYKKAIFTVEQVTLRHQRYDGSMSDEILRLNLERGDSVAALLHHAIADTITLVEQFRYSTYEKDSGWIIELPAGIVNLNEAPSATIQRELVEEVGYEAATLHHINTFYLSPGGSSERMHLYYARLGNKRGGGGGLRKEDEDIKTLVIPVDTALEWLRDGKIMDAKTIMALQWLQLNRNSLPQAPNDSR